MKNKFVILGTILLSFTLFSCTGDEENSNANSKPNSYFPLTANNLWTYKTPGMVLIEKINYIAVGTKSVDGQNYFIVTNSANRDTLFMREDAAGNVFELLNGTTEFKIIPASPSDTMDWQDGSFAGDVISTQAIVNGWTGLVEISIKQDGAEIRRDFYKKGVGLIRRIDRLSGTTITLNSYDLK